VARARVARDNAEIFGAVEGNGKTARKNAPAVLDSFALAFYRLRKMKTEDTQPNGNTFVAWKVEGVIKPRFLFLAV